jgi:hypothetical protein
VKGAIDFTDVDGVKLTGESGTWEISQKGQKESIVKVLPVFLYFQALELVLIEFFFGS